MQHMFIFWQHHARVEQSVRASCTDMRRCTRVYEYNGMYAYIKKNASCTRANMQQKERRLQELNLRTRSVSR